MIVKINKGKETLTINYKFRKDRLTTIFSTILDLFYFISVKN